MFKAIPLTLILLVFALAFTGCEAFRKKFVRKSKAEKEVRIVVQTIEYASQEPVDAVYEKYYIFWRAACDELIACLVAEESSRKRRIYTARKSIENLKQMQQLLIAEKQQALAVYISEQQKLLKQLAEYKLSRIRRLRLQRILEKDKRQIEREFALKDIQQYLLKR